MSISYDKGDQSGSIFSTNDGSGNPIPAGVCYYSIGGVATPISTAAPLPINLSAVAGTAIGNANPVPVQIVGGSAVPVSQSGTWTIQTGGSTVAAGQVSVGTSSTQIVGVRAGRKYVIITQLGTNDVYLGPTGVTTGTGDLLVGAKGSKTVVATDAAVYGVAGSTQSVSYLEVY